MKLVKFKVQNFRGLKGEHNEIQFKKSDIIFLIGQNNTGKSTFLRAYEFFTNSKQKATLDDFYNQDITNTIKMEGWFELEKDDDKDKSYYSKSDPDWATKWVNSDGYIKIKKEWNNINQDFKKYTFSPNEGHWVLNGFGGFDSLFGKAAPTPISINAMEDEASLGEKVNKLIQDQYLKSLKDNHQEQYKKVLQEIRNLQNCVIGCATIQQQDELLNQSFQHVFDGLKLSIEANTSENIKVEDLLKKNHTITIQKDGIERKDSFQRSGHGIIRQALFNFITFLLNMQEESHRKEYIILYEEPELFLHPKITFKLREELYNLAAPGKPYQILCATHSPMMIDISKDHSSLIRVVKNQDEETITYQVQTEVYTARYSKERVQMINRFNPHICEVFYADKVLLVEGDTETIVYRELLNKFFPEKEIFVLNTGSKMNIPFFQDILTAFHIKHYPIHDVDSKLINTVNGQKTSAAWSLNEKIWKKVETANTIESGLSNRYVHNANFENAHKYNLSNGKDKPLNAFLFVETIKDINQDVPCLNWLKDILGECKIRHDQEHVESIAKTIETIENDKKTYKTISIDDSNHSI